MSATLTTYRNANTGQTETVGEHDPLTALARAYPDAWEVLGTVTPADVDPIDRVLDARARLDASTAGLHLVPGLRADATAEARAAGADRVTALLAVATDAQGNTAPDVNAAGAAHTAARANADATARAVGELRTAAAAGNDTAAGKLLVAVNAAEVAATRVDFAARAVTVATITAEALELRTTLDTLRAELEATHTAEHLEQRYAQALGFAARFLEESCERDRLIRATRDVIVQAGFPGDSPAGRYDHLNVATHNGPRGDVEVRLDGTVHRCFAPGAAAAALSDAVARLADN